MGSALEEKCVADPGWPRGEAAGESKHGRSQRLALNKLCWAVCRPLPSPQKLLQFGGLLGILAADSGQKHIRN